jgi:hypothetical protein
MHHVHVRGEAREMDVDPVAKLSMISGVLSRPCTFVVRSKGRGRLCCLGASAVAIPTSIFFPSHLRPAQEEERLGYLASLGG